MELGSLTQLTQANSQSNANYTSAKITTDTAHATQKTQVDNSRVQVPSTSTHNSSSHVDLRSVDQQRLQNVRESLREAYKGFYAVSDRDFVIYKDSSGQLITRYTSLKDGKVTYVPEPKALEHAPAPKTYVSVNV